MSRKKMPSSIKNDKGSTSLLFDNNNNSIQSTDHNNNEINIDRNNIAFNQESSESNEQNNLRISNHCNTINSPNLKRDKEMDINDYNDLVDQNSSQCNDDDLSNNNEDLNEDEQLNELDLEEEDLSNQLNLNNRRTLINNKLTNGAIQSSPLNMCFSSDLNQNNLDKNLKTSLLNNFIKNTNDQSLLNKNFNQESVLSLNSTNNLNNSNEESYGVLLNTNEEDDEDSSNMVITPDIGDYSNYHDEDDVLDEPLPLSLKQGLTAIDDEDELENDLINEVKDDREGCRSLICESNGIIIAEMVYRCMVCANISDSINEAQRHYQIKHIFSQNIGLNNNASLNNYNWKTNSANSTRVSNNNTIAHMKNKELQQHLLQKQKLQRLQQIKLQQQRIQQIQRLQQQKLKEQKLQKSNQQKLLQFHQRFQQSQLQLQQQQRFEQLRQQQQLNELAQLQMQADSSPQQMSAVSKTVPDLNSLFLNPPIPGTVAKTPQTTHGSSRGGYVTCAVCSITKFYASVQRRYGQFTCMGCAKFFGRFLAKPKKFNCPNLGSCALNTSPRCKACLLLACINTYTIDEKRKVIVNANKPVQRPGPSGPLIGRASDTSTAKRKTTKV